MELIKYVVVKCLTAITQWEKRSGSIVLNVWLKKYDIFEGRL